MGFWNWRNNDSEKQLEVAPVVEPENLGGGLERTKAGHYAAATKPVYLRGVVWLAQQLCIAGTPIAFVFWHEQGCWEWTVDTNAWLNSYWTFSTRRHLHHQLYALSHEYSMCIGVKVIGASENGLCVYVFNKHEHNNFTKFTELYPFQYTVAAQTVHLVLCYK